MLKLKQISQAFGDSLSNLRKENHHTNTKITQKDHNDSHIFYLKTASDPNFDQQIFTLNFQNSQNIKSRLRIRENSKKQLQKSLILKQNSSQNSPLKDSIIKSTEFKKMSQYPKQRQNTKIDIKYSQQSNMRTNVIHFQNIKTSPLTAQSPQANRKNNPNRCSKRNYFNVHEFIQNEQTKKCQNSVILMRGNINSPSSLLKKIKQNSPKRKVDEYSKRIKSLQFNAIEVTKSIVEKNTNSNYRMRFKKNHVFIKPNYSFREGVESGDNLLQQSSNLQHKGQMWRSNSYQIPKKSKFFEQQDDKNNNKNKSKFFNQTKQKSVRSQKFDNLLDLNPWSHQVLDDERLRNSKTPYTEIKTQRIENQKRRDDENQFINYYIKTSRYYQNEDND